ncbi:apolipoprotein N-acyltransferase [Acuticoccus sp. I52.16.1]|uniref:apolipoprotein N-acyltransferase n=1 Tax=Acuticoccus sp. I52.16.1 TaxID=2928472 RepID=UPI001FD27FAC|nr:apolipoprotein N-acyltransferase [Acuticoccus sp. I52.16.1]UOM33589.1 apolipoprotein N-acyltransferase [Acuticoccus sp. I52.16.1]
MARPFRWAVVRAVAALVCGAVLSLTLPPFDLLPALAAYSGLAALAAAGDRWARRRIAHRALLGAAFGFGYHVAGLWWIGEAFLVDAAQFGALIPLAVVGLPLALAPFHAVAVALAGLAPPGFARRTVALAVALALTEWVRGFAFTGFPWNVPAVQISSIPALVQPVALVGVAGMAPLAILLGAVPALVVARSWRLSGAVLMAAIAAIVYGEMRLTQDAIPLANARIRIVQPSIPQREKWDPDERNSIWATLLRLTAEVSEAGARPSVVVWPETALPFLWSTPSLEQMQLSRALGPGAVLVTGAVEIEATNAGRRATNSILVIDDRGEVTDRYDKAHLVPFGEYVPFAGVLTRIGLGALAAGTDTFVPGDPRDVLEVPGLPPARPRICYEAIFPHQPGHAPAGWILNLTNDAWFGDTPGPYQHFRHVVLRSIEAGLPTVRVANTGLSGTIDAYGRVKDEILLSRLAFRDISLSESVSTLYARFGYAPFLLVVTLLLAWVALGRRSGV